MKNQIKLLKKYGISNYTIENDKITINGSLDLSSLTSADKDFLKGTTINGYLYLRSLTSADKDFLKGTTINGSLDLRSLTSADKDFLKNNVKKLKDGYNKEQSYCFFDGILLKVISVSVKKEYTIYTTTNGFVAQKNKFTAHGNTIKKSIQDLEFKIISEKLKKEPIKEDTEFTIKYYRLITGACEAGCVSFMRENNIEFNFIDGEAVELDKIKAKDLLPMLEKSKAYGLEMFKSLIQF